MTEKELKTRVNISQIVSHFISFFPEAIQKSKDGGDMYIADRHMRDYEVISLYRETYMDGFCDSIYDEDTGLDNETIRFIITTVYGLILKYTIRNAKRMNTQYEEVYGEK